MIKIRRRCCIGIVCRIWHIVRLAKIPENAILRFMAACIVSFVDLDGIRHSVEVDAEVYTRRPF